MLDAHHHLWDVSKRDYPWMDGPWADPLRGCFDAAAFERATAGTAITASLVVQAVSGLSETQELLAASHRLIAGVVGWADLTAPEVSIPEGLVGVRHQVQDEPDARWLLRPDVLNGLKAVADAGLVYDLLVTPRELPAAIEVARRLPQLRFVLDHLGKPRIAEGEWQPWADQITELAALANVTAKISGLVTEAGPDRAEHKIKPYLRHAVDVFGPDRIMWGSDWPVCTLVATYDQVVAISRSLLSDLTETELADVFGGTARRVYLGR